MFHYSDIRLLGRYWALIMGCGYSKCSLSIKTDCRTLHGSGSQRTSMFQFIMQHKSPKTAQQKHFVSSKTELHNIFILFNCREMLVNSCSHCTALLRRALRSSAGTSARTPAGHWWTSTHLTQQNPHPHSARPQPPSLPLSLSLSRSAKLKLYMQLQLTHTTV